MKKYFLVFIFSLFIFSVYSVAQPVTAAGPAPAKSEIQVNPVKIIFSEVFKVQRKLNFEITKTLRKIKKEKDPKVLAIGLFFAFLYGSLHALGPGHSKAIIVSYFISNEEKLKKVPIMAYQISMTHVITPILFVLLANLSLRQIISDPDKQIYWFKFISFLLVIGIGLFMLINKLINIKKDACSCKHNSTALAFSAGLVPCIGSLLILLFTAASKMFYVGVMLVIAIGLGIGTTITMVGLLSFYFRKLITFNKSNNVIQILLKIMEFAGPVFIIIFGIIMFAGLFS